MSAFRVTALLTGGQRETVTATAAAGTEDCQPSAALEAALMAAYAFRATLGRMEDLGQIAAVVVAAGTAIVFALMAWAGQHQS